MPAHRYTRLRETWSKIHDAIVKHLKLQVRYNEKTKNVELRTGTESPNMAHLLRGTEFIKAILCGFDYEDALPMLRSDDLYIESFEVLDIKQTLKGDHLSRAVGRIAGKGGKMKLYIENTTDTRIVVDHSKISILGLYNNIRVARRSISDLVLGLTPPRVCGHLRAGMSRRKFK